MSEVSRNGRTVLFVSHNMMAVQTLCNRGLWLSQGQLVMDGDAQTVVSKYLQSGAQALTEQYWADPAEAPGNEFIKLNRIRVVAENPSYITVDDDFEFECAYWNGTAGARINLSLHVYTVEGVCVFASISDSVPHHAGLVVETCRIPGRLLNDGVYRFRMMFVRDMNHVLFDYQNAALFEVFEGPRDATWYGKMPGVVRPQLAWKAADVTECLSVDGIPLGAERG
jgi:lipopolysaccharide transport system ATP-binding protein